MRAFFMNVRALTQLPDYQGPHQNLGLLYRDFFHDEDLAAMHFKQWVAPPPPPPLTLRTMRCSTRHQRTTH